MTSFKSVVALLLTILASVTMATEKVTVQGRGVAKTYDDAVQNALKDAVRQVNGSAFFDDTTVVLNSTTTNDNTTVTEDVDNHLHEVLKGVVLGHRVLNEKTRDDGLFEVRLEVDVARYVAPMNDGREKVAVMLIKPMLVGFQIGGDGKDCFRPAPLVTEELTSRITTAIVQTKRFGVLSREDEEAIRAEEMIITESAPVAEMVKVGQRLGADYLVTGTLRNIHVGKPETTINQLTGRRRSVLSSATLRMTYRVVVVSTAQIAWADNVDIEFDQNTLAQYNGRPGAAYASLLEKASQRVGVAFANNLYRDPPTQSEPSPTTNVPVDVTIVIEPTLAGGVRLPFDK